jgi:DNA replication and repair protein RecF
LPLSRVRITSLRCLAEVELVLSPARNYVLGPNGAGKTSILEAVFLLGRGRSFRTRQIRRLIRHGTDGFAVYGEVNELGRAHKLGVAFAAGRLEKKIDGARARSTVDLAGLFPVYAIDPGAHELIQGGPSDRRRFLDWGVFHVEHAYLDMWRRYRRVLGQRNAALKARVGPAELRPWTEALIDAGTQIHAYRERYVAELQPVVSRRGSELIARELEFEYLPGWRPGLPLAAAFADSEVRDRELGNTEVGPHRADLVVRLDGRRAHDEASRGQQKLAAAALILGQADVYTIRKGGSGTLLVDDPAAELDANALERLLAQLFASSAQLVITGLSTTQMPVEPEFPVFHVEHGRLQAL